jgi:FtsH-binding integral membrane protein
MADTISAGINTFINGLNRKLEPPVQSHLKSVYSTMSLALLAAAGGAYLHLYSAFIGGGILSFLGALGFAIALWSTPHHPKNVQSRLGYLIGFALCIGLSSGPLLDAALIINPSLIITALLSTCVMFGCFTVSTFFADHRKYLYLGGTLTSMLSIMVLVSFLNIFLRSRFLFDAYLYVGLFVFCGFICYDTALIIEKKRMGDDDFIAHAMMLFMDFVTVFKKILIILMKREAEKDNRKKRNN